MAHLSRVCTIQEADPSTAFGMTESLANIVILSAVEGSIRAFREKLGNVLRSLALAMR